MNMQNMQTVKLYTMGGGFVVAGRVPRFLTGKEADVLLWGARIFRLNRSCPECGGRGEVLDAPENVLGGRAYWEPCPVCHGKGGGNAITDHDGALLYTEAFTVALVITDESVTA